VIEPIDTEPADMDPASPESDRVAPAAASESPAPVSATTGVPDGLDGLTIAVPRGALFAGTVDLLTALGLDTTELRTNDRKLLFSDIGVITMRPSDVPTYVEDGAADLGITGKDVLLERGGRAADTVARERGRRQIYELLDLGYGRCTMVLATADRVNDRGEDPAREALRRLGTMRVATKYPRIAARYLQETGRQGEIVEVKGSVELAPLTGLAEAIIDLTATGTTLRENGLVVREEIVVCTSRLIANPVAYKLKAAQIDRLLERLRAS
jgi:ATP phosphoribosyltransferase